MPRRNLIEFREGTAADWTAANPVLNSGEPGFESDTKKLKIGDGATAWNSLSYVTGGGGGGGGTWGSNAPMKCCSIFWFVFMGVGVMSFLG